MKSLPVTAASIIISVVFLTGSASAENQVFSNPKVGAQRLDLCLNWGSGCGKPAADAWCVSQGYISSAGHAVANDIGAATPTRLISTGAVCDKDFCDGFSSVTCFKPGYVKPKEQAYNKPKFNGMRLDLCVDWGSGCGLPAANKFCKANGWNKAKYFSAAVDLGKTQPTRLIGTGAVCDQDFCDGFKTITCEN